MLLRFRVANHRSIREAQELSLVAVPDDGEPKLRAGDIPPTVQVAGIYGANASGKSNVLDALRWMVRAIADSHTGWPADGGVPRRPYGLDADSRERSTTCEVDVLHDGIRCTYGFEVDDEAVRGEWLHTYPNGRTVTLFERAGYRDESGYRFGRALAGAKERIRRRTRPHSLYLSAAAAENHPMLSDIHRVLVGGMAFADQSDQAARLAAVDRRLGDDADRARLADLLRYADLGVDGIRRQPAGLELRHGGDGESEAWLPLADQSAGTRAWLGLMPLLLDALRQGSVLCVDEIDADLHPLLTATLVRAFKEPETNRRGAQLIFSSHHDSTLLGVMLAEDLLARGEIWFTDKDRAGVTSLFSLAEFRAREGENVELGYRQGRYGVVPYVDGDQLSRVLRSIWDPAVGAVP